MTVETICARQTTSTSSSLRGCRMGYRPASKSTPRPTRRSSELPSLALDAITTHHRRRLRSGVQKPLPVSLLGSLLYASVWTRPDIAYPVGILYRAIGSPTSILFDAALRVLAYLGRHKSVGLRYESRSSPLARRGTLMLIPRHTIFLVHH